MAIPRGNVDIKKSKKNHLTEPGKMIDKVGTVAYQPDVLLTRAINFVKTQKDIDIPEGWEDILGLLCAKFAEKDHLTAPGKMIPTYQELYEKAELWMSLHSGLYGSRKFIIDAMAQFAHSQLQSQPTGNSVELTDEQMKGGNK